MRDVSGSSWAVLWAFGACAICVVTNAARVCPVQASKAALRGEPGLEGEPVYIGTREGTKAALVEGEVDTFVKRLQAVSGRLDKLFPSGEELDRDGLEAVIELAAWTHSEWVRIHPFRNGNGRTARILTNAILMRYGLPPVLRLRPRPLSPYGQAGVEGLEGNSKPMETLLRRLFKDFPKDD